MMRPKSPILCALVSASLLLVGVTSTATAEDPPAAAFDPWEGVPPPEWNVGMTWTYEVTGSFYRTSDYEATFGVIGETSSYFVLGSDSETDLTNGVLGLANVMTGQVQKDSFGILEHDQYQSLTGFYRAHGSSWNVTLWGLEFEVTKGEPETVTHAIGASLGRVTHGATHDGQTLVVEYANDARWITKLEWRDAQGGLRLAYTLTDYDHAGFVWGMKVWEPTDWTVMRAIGNSAPLGAQRWINEGGGDFVLLRAETDAHTTGLGRVTAPSLLSYEFQHSGGGDDVRKVRSEPGDWTLTLATDRGTLTGGQMTMWTFLVEERVL